MTQKKSYRFSLLTIAVLYFVFGFVTWLNGTLIPFLKTACQLNDFLAYFVTFAFYIAYFVTALPSAALLKKTGFKHGISIGLFTMTIGSALFIPAATNRSYILFLTGLFIMGTGLSVMQTAVNPYVTILGPMESAARRISIMGICNKLAGIIAPLVLSAFLIAGSNDIYASIHANAPDADALLDALAMRLIKPYVVMTILLLALGIIMTFIHLPDVQTEESSADNSHKKSIFRYPHLWFGVIALFFYVGVEVIAGDTIIRYGESLGIAMESAKYYTSITLLAMLIGYFIGVILIPRIISQRTALVFCSLSGIIFSILIIFTSARHCISFPFIDITTFKPITMTIPYTVLFVALLGLSNSLIWPAIWPLSLDGIGNHTETASALLIMSIAGGAVIPLLYGKCSDLIGTQDAYQIAIWCYVIILAFALFGCQWGKNKINR